MYNEEEFKEINSQYEKQFGENIDNGINNYKNNILNILENNVDIDFKKMEENYEVYSNAYEKIHLESNNIDESLDEYLNNRNIIDPTTYYSDTQKEVYNNLNSQENQMMDIVGKEYGKLDPSNFDPNSRYDEFNKIENQVSNAKDLHSYAVNNFSNINNLEFNVDKNNDLNLSFSNNGKEVLLNKSNNDEIVESENSKIQNLKSVELEKNVIGLLPKEQQENNYKETLSRLEKNKSTLKDDLKSYMSNAKIDNAINSVKQHFENVKVKAEDIHKTFKDLGQWNTDNKFVKNIDTVVNKVKNISLKSENKIDLNDPKLLEKLQNKFKESNKFIESVEEENNKYSKLKETKANYLRETLSIASPHLLENSKQTNENISQLSSDQKIDLYNYAKDIESLTKDKNFSSYEDMKNNLDTIKITSNIENDLGKNFVDDKRQEYLTSNIKKPATTEKIYENLNQLNDYIEKSNTTIGNVTKSDLKNYQQNANNELNNIQQNKRANELKNNDLLQKFNNQEKQIEQPNEEKETLENKEKKKQTRGMNI